MIDCLHAALCPCALPTLILDADALFRCDDVDPLDRGKLGRALDPTRYRRHLYEDVVTQSMLHRTQKWLVLGDAASAYLRRQRRRP